MDEVIFTCLGLAFGLFLLATAIAGWVALVRARRLEKELGALRSEVRALARERVAPSQSATAATSVPARETASAPTVQSSAEKAAALARERPATP
ncbi:MAG: hypothetical protein ABL998_13955, partial [Planctomycetota bacterium]